LRRSIWEASGTSASTDTDKDGVVFLSGSVRTQEEANRAVAVARETEGVRSVNSKLTVKPEK
jgi:hyperosmotically inducible protein